jgi:hypothetical protein
MTLGIGQGGWGEAAAEKSILETLTSSVAMGSLATFNVVAFTLLACIARKVAMGDADFSNTGTPQGWTKPQIAKNNKAARDCACGAFDAGLTLGPIFFGKVTPQAIVAKVALGYALGKMGKQIFCA